MVPENIEYVLDFEEEEDYKDIDPEVKAVLYKTILEAVQNIIKHSKAKYFTIELELCNHILNLIVQDNGIGMPKNVKFGLGIKTIEYSLNKFGGDISIKNGEIKGTILKLTIPYND